MATASGSGRNGRDSHSKRLGVKKFDGQAIRAGGIIVRQRGTKVHPGAGTMRAKDDTIFAIVDGTIKFQGARVCVIAAQA